LATGCGENTRKVRRPAGAEIAFEDRYLALIFSIGRISICLWAAITHCYHTPLIFIQKRIPEERTSNQDKLCMNTTQYVTEILEPCLAPFICSLLGNPYNYQTVKDGLRVYSAKL
jgi:hypothetical protein